MQYSTLALLLPALTMAAPAPAASSDPSKAFRQFGVKVHVPDETNPDCHSTFEGGYIASYHTGAGLGDATLIFDASYSRESPAFLNGTALQFDLSNGEIQWRTSVLAGQEQTFGKVTIDAAASSQSGFFINETGIQLQREEFPGWLVCDFWHAVPQLFALNYGSTWPKSCEKVQLLPEYYD